MSGTPRTWAEVMQRLAYVFGGHEGEPYATAEEWIREACETTWGADLIHLHRTQRQLALQRSVGTLLALEDEGDLVFRVGVRPVVQAVFARFWKGVALDGPPWRLDPSEERPLYELWAASLSSSFD